jgi:hypothetical protein
MYSLHHQIFLIEFIALPSLLHLVVFVPILAHFPNLNGALSSFDYQPTCC